VQSGDRNHVEYGGEDGFFGPGVLGAGHVAQFVLDLLDVV